MLSLRQHNSPETTQPFDLRDRGLLLADGVFDTSLMIDGEMMFKTEHLQRLVKDAAALDISISIAELDAHIEPSIDAPQTGAFRLTVTRGPTERGAAADENASPTLLSTLNPLDPADLFPNISLLTSDILRNTSSPTSRHKTLCYVDNVLAMQAAQAKGFDNALFMNAAGHVCCTAIGNIFLLIDGIWRTPPISDGVLAGIMRGWLLDQAGEIGFEIVEESVPHHLLSSVDAALMTNSLKLFAPITQIDDREIDTVESQNLISRAAPLLPPAISAFGKIETGRNDR